jgi:hypothetical protein
MFSISILTAELEHAMENFLTDQAEATQARNQRLEH